MSDKEITEGLTCGIAVTSTLFIIILAIVIYLLTQQRRDTLYGCGASSQPPTKDDDETRLNSLRSLCSKGQCMEAEKGARSKTVDNNIVMCDGKNWVLESPTMIETENGI